MFRARPFHGERGGSKVSRWDSVNPESVGEGKDI